MHTGIPLIAPCGISSFTPADYMTYVSAMHKAPAAPPPQPEAVSLTLTKTGKPSVKVKGRKPPYVMQSEFLMLCKAHKVRQNVLFLHLKKRGITVTNGTAVKVTLTKT